VAERPRSEPPVCGALPVAWLVDGSGDVLARIELLANGPAPLEPLRLGLKAGIELPSAVERGNDDVPALMTLRVISVVVDDVAAQAVVVGVDSGHNGKSGTGAFASRPPASVDIGCSGVS